MEGGQYHQPDAQIARFAAGACPVPSKILPSTQSSLPHGSPMAKDCSAIARSGASRNGSESTFRKAPSERPI
jgi:hypothetical protein